MFSPLPLIRPSTTDSLLAMDHLRLTCCKRRREDSMQLQHHLSTLNSFAATIRCMALCTQPYDTLYFNRRAFSMVGPDSRECTFSLVSSAQCFFNVLLLF
jgi:hypothetical protein